MLVAEAMNKDVKTIRPDATVKEAVQLMNQHHIGSLVVVSGTGEAIGIVTERDIMTDVVGEGRDSGAVRVEEIMTKELVIIGPNSTLEEAANIMIEHKIKKLPVVEDGHLVGIITTTDLIRYERSLIERISQLISSSPMKQIGG
jgi:CBS domain-containing protein